MSDQPSLPTVGHVYSHYQIAIHDDFAHGKGHTVIEAVVGGSKTTSVLEGVKRVPAGTKVLFMAFNSSTATTLKKRVPAGVVAKTSHGVGFGAIRYAWQSIVGEIAPDDTREFKMSLDIAPKLSPDDRGTLLKIVGFAKAWVIMDPDQLVRLADYYDCRPRSMPIEEMTALVLKILQLSLVPSNTISFDDMVFIPVALGLRPRQYDMVVVDEAQDLSAGQVRLALMCLRPHGRMIVVGDSRQAIYAFRGADSESMNRMAKKLNAKKLPLSVTYRCPKLVVEHVKSLVPQIEARPGAPDGTVESCVLAGMLNGWKPGDFVLSRVNAPLVRLCVRAWRQGIRAAVMGRDVGKGLRDLMDRYDGNSVTGLLDFVMNWRDSETARLTAAKKLDRIDAVYDRAETIVALSEGMATLSEMRARITALFADSAGSGAVDPATHIIFSSTHKAKGLEAERVWVLSNTFRHWSGEQEECNLYYVACTRALADLRLVQWDPKTQELP